MTRAVVFGYGDVGVRCLAAVLAHGVEVPLVVTHEDDPAEHRWYSSMRQFACEHGIPVLLANAAARLGLHDQVALRHPDFIFSFYYRRMLPQAVLDLAPRGALNMHGSLLPKFRGRAPVNWAVLMGETETGATLHYMTEKPDAGAIVGQRGVPIFPDDTALDVFRKVCCAAELVLHEALPRLLDGSASAVPQDLAQGSYFGARRPDDGIIDWSWPAQRVHDLVRAVAPPFPGARTRIAGTPARILRTLRTGSPATDFPVPTLFQWHRRCYASCGDGGVLRLLEVELEGASVDLESLAQRLLDRPVALMERGSQ